MNLLILHNSKNITKVFYFNISVLYPYTIYSIARCSKELNQWDLMLEYANSKGNTNPHLVLESAWRVPNWALMKDALSQVYTCSLGHRELWFFLSIIYKYGAGSYYFFLYPENTVRYIELYCFFAVIRICIQWIIWFFW